MKLFVALIVASASALAPPNHKGALAVRGGAMLDKSTPLKISTAVFGMYAGQMLFAPTFMWTQNFKMNPDKYHNFLARIAGVGWLSLLKGLWSMDVETAFPLSFLTSAACTVVGPIVGETMLEPNTAHGAVYVLFPLLLGAHLLAL
mmetsp:Transcript_293/g.805  ORF Transcript_293/g.805 Transcript_293/m.805 type:complete len:146 (-) Transcript_293:105-542(-)